MHLLGASCAGRWAHAILTPHTSQQEDILSSLIQKHTSAAGSARCEPERKWRQCTRTPEWAQSMSLCPNTLLKLQMLLS